MHIVRAKAPRITLTCGHVTNKLHERNRLKRGHPFSPVEYYLGIALGYPHCLVLLTLKHIEEYIVSITVVCCRLVLPGNEDSSPGRLSVLLQSHVKAKQVLGILGGGGSGGKVSDE